MLLREPVAVSKIGFNTIIEIPAVKVRIEFRFFVVLEEERLRGSAFAISPTMASGHCGAPADSDRNYILDSEEPVMPLLQRDTRLGARRATKRWSRFSITGLATTRQLSHVYTA